MDERLTFAKWAAQSGLGNGEIARKIGRDISTVSELVAGRRWPSADTALKILELSGGAVSVWDASVFQANRRLSLPRQEAA